MRVRVDAQSRFWAEVPAAFPAEAVADRAAWRRDVVERVRSVRSAAGGDLVAHEVDAVEAIADAALDALAPGAAFGLLFLPWPHPVAALVHVEVGGPRAGGADPVAMLLGGIPVARTPQVETVEVPGLGSGVSVRFLVEPPDAEPGGEPAAGIGYLVRGEHCAVRVTTSPMTTTMAGLIDGPLREVVSTLRIEE